MSVYSTCSCSPCSLQCVDKHTEMSVQTIKKLKYSLASVLEESPHASAVFLDWTESVCVCVFVLQISLSHTAVLSVPLSFQAC